MNHFSYAQPDISSFAPTSGPIGTVVNISGSNFSTTPANNIVYFGAVKANVTNASSGSLTVTVPYGATYKPISVTVNGYTTYASKPFLVTFTNAGNISSNSFAQSIDSTTDLHPNDLVMVDFDGDGKSDLATANNYSTTGSPASVSILRNTSSGGNISFASHQDIFTGVQTYSIAAGDLDGDGKPDMISGSIVDKTISVFRNISSPGAISFAPKTDYATDDNPYSIAVGDLDGDGRPDIAVTNYVSNTISIYKNTSSIGNISFAAKADISTGADLGPWAIVIGDLDGDGKPDMAVTNNYTNTVSVFRNASVTGNISFAAPIHFYADLQPMGLAIGDMDGDGKPDLVWAINGENIAFRVELNQSSPGNLAFAATPSNIYNISSAYDVAISDINGDGHPDLVISSHGKISLFQNASTIGNVSFSAIADFPGNSPFAEAVGDLNNDGYPDIAVGNFTSNSVSIYKNQILLPSILSFTPTIAGKDSTVTISGNNFLGTVAVSFGGIPAKSYTVIDNTTITAVVDTGAGGDIKVTNAYGSASLPGFSFNGPPAVKSFTPISADSGVVVKLTGINFIQVTGVCFGGTPALSFNIISPTIIEAVVGIGVSGDITVTNTYGTGSIPGFVVAQPVISSFAPASAGRKDTITIMGSNFSAVTGVSFGGTDASSFNIISPTEIRAVVKGGTSGSVSVKTVRAVSVPGFTFYLPPAPVISSVFPDSGQTGSIVTITGNNFSSTAANDIVYFGAVRANIVLASPTSLTAEVPDGVTYETISVVNTETELTGRSNTFFNVTQPIKGTIDSTLFAPPVTFTNPNNYEAQHLLLCDFNNDGKPDIAGYAAGSFISVRKNTSTKKVISFADGIIVPIFGANDGGGNYSESAEIRVADLDGDGKKDLVVMQYRVNDTGYVSVYRNISTTDSILFAPQVDFKTVVNISNILVFDIDGDGRTDIIAEGEGYNFPQTNSTLILLNTSSGMGDISFENSSYSLPVGVNIGLWEDFDGDGKPDIIFGSALSVYCSQNTSTPGNISFAAPFLIYAASVDDHDLSSIVAGDIDGDGKNDLFLVNSGNSSGAFAVLRNTSSGSNISFTNTEYFTGGFPYNGVLNDMDGDGKPDLVIGELFYNGITIYQNTSSPGNISFAARQLYNIIDNHRLLAIGDFDGDSKPDIALTTGQGDYGLKVLRNQMNELDISSNGPTHFCEGGQITLHSSLHSGNQWYKDGAMISGATADSIVVTINGKYTDTVTMQGLQIAADTNIIITVIPTPDKPYITQVNNNELISSSLSGNQWFNDSSAINGATDSIYLPTTQNGNYRVQVTFNGCASAISDPYHYVAADSANPVILYPNPVTDCFRIVFDFPNVKSVTVVLYNMRGEKIFEKENVTSGNILCMTTYPPGDYILKLINESNNEILSSKQIIKL